MSPALARAAAALVLTLATACGQTVRLHAPPDSRVQIGEQAPVVVGGDGTAEAEVPVGFFAPRYSVRTASGSVVEEATVPRTELSPWVSIPLVSSIGCTVPPAMAAGFCLANPGLLCGPCLGLAGTAGLVYAFNGLATTLDRPSAATVPVMMTCAVLGASQLWFLPFALRAPDELSVGGVQPPPTHPEPRAPAPAPRGAMLW
jgi:hypothetical protein